MITIKRLGTVSAISATLLMAGCGFIDDGKDKMYGSNADIVQEGDSFSYTSQTGSTSTRIADLEFEGFSGTETIWSLDAEKKADLRIDYSLTVDKGEFKVVLVTPSDRAVTIEEGSVGGISIVTLDKGRNRIKFVGVRTAGKVEMHLQAGNAIKITNVSNR
ncbi:hypothetical protein SAMN04487895_11875 [Paenibacillus sophorae]|uniref:Uncharacterized protein n=1 Tax=Paenibacillus sophorae TaxID=1333845 RepID=A0A1H8UPK0_9BACL|nr:hypothetical protein [Paenibacillus sophorae]QWU13329.1 hypothetical protein KP014_15070 [Paenibacillus sophorae]SEP04824.1 hypothetical protein SAMN04487895_11875 [Paenibacillus sophorae]